MAFREQSEPAPGLLTSKFLVTVSTNQALPEEQVERGRKWLHGKLRELLINFNRYLTVYRVAGPKEMIPQRATPEQITRLLHDAKFVIKIEFGSSHGKLHSHSIITFSHDPKFRFRTNLPKLREAMPHWYLNVKFVKDHSYDLEKYIRKDEVAS
jgi:hypothetical protein